jgi:hypothetical protein
LPDRIGEDRGAIRKRELASLQAWRHAAQPGQNRIGISIGVNLADQKTISRQQR